MTTLILLSIHRRTFRAEASISQAELPTMRECGEMVGYIVRAEPDAAIVIHGDIRVDTAKV